MLNTAKVYSCTAARVAYVAQLSLTEKLSLTANRLTRQIIFSLRVLSTGVLTNLIESNESSSVCMKKYDSTRAGSFYITLGTRDL